MPTDFKNFTPDNIPSSDTTTENQDVSVQPDTDGGIGGDNEYGIWRRKVFPEGFPTGKTVGSVKTLQLTASTDARLLETHGVTSASDVLEVLHPDGLSLLDSVTSQNAYVVVRGSMKIVDIAASNWPINLAQAKDVRANLKQPVQLGNDIGMVAGCFGDLILFKGSSESLVPIQDLRPVMIDRR